MSEGQDGSHDATASQSKNLGTPAFGDFSHSDTDVVNLEQSFASALEIMKTQAVSFYQAFKGLPKERFMAVTAVYAFCRYADDVVDEGGSSALPQLDDLERSIRALFEDGTGPTGDVHSTFAPTLPWWPAFTASVHRYGVQERGLLMQIQGQRRDADFHDIESTDDLIEYARLVAGSVGRILVPILVRDRAMIENEDFMQACEKLGIAMQITNILRDVGEDIRERDRVYIPRDLLKSHGISREALQGLAHADAASCKERTEPWQDDAPSIPRNFIVLWEQLATLADSLYLPYQQYLDQFHASARIPLITAAKLYQAIEQAVRDHGHDCFTRRCYTSKATRIRIVTEIQLREKAPWKIS
ncbi:phytoene/squalene synthase family protein [Bifidobacterium sp.]|uniref:phytoene/squalene synthase family protein n=1 Tax=Bifidobacterium sp. TaxID=41200 RepID=UPI0039EC0853